MIFIPKIPKRTITKKIDLWNYYENDEDDKDKWEVDYVGDVGLFFDTIVYEKEFDDDRENPMSMGGEVHVEVEDQYGKFILLSNDNIDAMKKDDLYAGFL